MASKSVFDENPRFALANVVDGSDRDNLFRSKDAPGQWISWDFGEMRIRPTHYTIRAFDLQSWVVEGSLDGTNWTEVDRQAANQDFRGPLLRIASFAVSTPAEVRFIRLTQTGRSHSSKHIHDLSLLYVDFFGSLSE
jgi:hypothetical protein